MAGALPEAELLAHTSALGFRDVRITERFDCFAGTSVEQHVASHLRPQGANFHAVKAGARRSTAG